MPSSALLAARVPDRGYAASVPTVLADAIADIEAGVVPRFTTTTQRDTAYTAWTAAGGDMAKVALCMVGNDLYKRKGSSWKLVPTEAVGFRAQRTLAASIPHNTWRTYADEPSWSHTGTAGIRNGSTLTITSTGWWHIGASASWANDSAGARGVRLDPAPGCDLGSGSGNPVNLQLVGAAEAAGGIGVDTTVAGSLYTPLDAGDEIDVQVYQSSGSALSCESFRIWARYEGPL